MASPTSTRTGISGWRYAGWRNAFYPPQLPQAHELAFASRALQTIEINGSHYALQTPASYQSWYAVTPPHFMFSVKAPRFVTHILRLRGERSATAIANFLASGLFNLREKLGPILWQFPPSLRFDPDLFEAFLQGLPHDTETAVEVAKHHDAHIKHVCLKTDRKRPLHHAIEIRHPSFCDETFIQMLRKYRAALVFSDSTANWPYAEDVTADFIYMRLHGTETLYSGAYSDNALDCWAKRIRTWENGSEPRDAQRIAGAPSCRKAAKKPRDVFCYFDNDQKVRAPFDAARLASRLRGSAVENDMKGLQHSLWNAAEVSDLLTKKRR
ncbi:DUF72 domain-containing protein [Oxalicibacterium solurbis]|uniref:DUF72 domain-containing protein n=1 Tax=Oxalicibacterium solurbis TaxID=69280 RepID=A0A8J3B1J1_9BURK|nr:DUF72 domain-containing protein [Oxalicibacterium solurbis]GGI53363.1 hypothetical protein GCM10011430_05370 [Oxalicibacterium solurbis]